MNSLYEAAGARIRKLREVNRYTREEFAEIAEISPKFLYEIETGQKGFSADTLYRIAKGLSVSCEYILSGDYQAGFSEEVLEVLNLYSGAQMKDISRLLKTIYELSTKTRDPVLAKAD